ncbi:MAG: lipoate--protein ligase [Clostridia bacterium]|nr:lipoate--protein ligase [Clostridia bacterium]
MRFIHNKSTNPYFNIASEEYILNEFSDECFMLYRNKPCIIVGKNQNTLSEINVEYTEKNNIPVVRRMSGGGAVFHDLGNLNFTFIINSTSKQLKKFSEFTAPIIEALKTLSIDAEFSGRNDITIDGKKISGNAQYYKKNKVLHHGTLLFSSNITDISAALKINPLKYKDKSSKSVPARITNISSHLKAPLTIEEFIDIIMNHIMEMYGQQNIYEFKNRDIENINKLVQQKYSTWNWNFGESPNYSFKNEKKFPGGFIEFHLDVEAGIIKKAKLFGDFFGIHDISQIEQALIGIEHSKQSIKKQLSRFNINEYLANITLDELMEGFF